MEVLVEPQQEKVESEIFFETEYNDSFDNERENTEGENRMVENTEGVPKIAEEIESILEKSNHKDVTPDFKINITVKDGCVDDIKVNMQHKRPRE